MQYCMNPVIFEYPNRSFYGGKLTSHNKANLPLDAKLATAMKDLFGIGKSATDSEARLQYIEVKDSVVRKSTRTHSRANLEHVEWITMVMEKLCPVFKEETFKDVFIKTP
ncbi:uncharacterized protein K452DRAFT_302578 [Aplosporella prunicola CBS 121167]|uniref:DNA2/NAM7 helicase-like C-terminal domain-containing protein n=1 Tax=Aplosporella prunicola CBS 121167 TaxID=1176127 RepID=A0A6A6AZM0_9PEZI|nr:uncharacterized protein K452DRAFT_302578 [Aplosporella prunicola CBS 121167]KAF2136633.1 hypothetical protein K452DRAFT_302578 [Aplosporella prunicola CBS 121167]